jgi:hypothetical protein
MIQAVTEGLEVLQVLLDGQVGSDVLALVVGRAGQYD